MSSCTFFGHRDVSQKIEPTLRTTLIELIENKNVDSFYVGNHGDFDLLVRKVLKSLKMYYPHINYAVVLAYMPYKTGNFNDEDYSVTILPDGLENVPHKYSIIKRNRWMIDKSDYVVTYVVHSIGGAAQFKEIAEKKRKIVINLAKPED